MGLAKLLAMKNNGAVSNWNTLTNKPTTVSTSGITDAETITGSQAKATLAKTQALSYTDGAIATMMGGAPAMLDTLYELANALGNDPDFSATVLNLIGTKASSIHGHAWGDISGTPTTVSGYGITDVYTRTQVEELDTTVLASANAYTDNKTDDLAKRADVIQLVIASLPSHYQRDAPWSQKTGVNTSLTSPGLLTVNVNNAGYLLPSAISIDLTQASAWDNVVTDYTIANNRAGKDFYIYACQQDATVPKIILSFNATMPTGYTALNSRKIGGFHCLCTDVGLIPGHALTGYIAGDILPTSVWDLSHRPASSPEGMVYDSGTDRWIDIYLASVASGNLVSINNGVIADGASSPAFHWYKGSQWMAKIKKDLLTQRQFISASLGSNQGTNIVSNTDPNATTGHSDTSGRRMISNIGCEDICGVLWQWGSEAGGPYSAAAWGDAYDANDDGVAGQQYVAPNRVILGGGWNDGALCGSRGSGWLSGPLSLASYVGLRGCAEPLRGA